MPFLRENLQAVHLREESGKKACFLIRFLAQV